MTDSKRMLWILLTAGAMVLFVGIYFFRSAKESVMFEESKRDGNGELVEQALPLGEIRGVNAGGMFHVYLRKGQPEAIMETPGNLLGEVGTDIRDGILYLNVNGTISSSSELNVYLPMDGIQSIELNGMATLEGDGPLNSESLMIKAGGMSNVELELNVPHLDVNCSGSADVILRGFTEEFSADCSGMGELKAEDLTALWAIVETSGSSDVALRVEEHLTANSSGASEIRFWGKPQVDAKTSGGGTVKGVEE